MSLRSRSLLFVPGDRPDRFDKAVAAGADRVIVDLEDAVAPADKSAARDAVANWLAAAPRSVLLRINAVDTPWFADDLRLCAAPGVAGVVLPKTERATDVAKLVAAGCAVVLPLIESGAGFTNLDAIAGAAGVERLLFGSIDLQVDLGMRDAHEDELLYFRSRMVLASRGASIEAPIDGVSTAIDDPDRLRDDVLRARRLGFAGKLCIHPRQVEGVHRHFAPSAADCAWARRVLEAVAAAGGAAIAVDGKMVDKPVILRAETILREAGAA